MDEKKLEIEFKLNRRQLKNLREVLEGMKLFWKGDIEGVVKIFENSFNIDDVEVKTSEKEQMLLKTVTTDGEHYSREIEEILQAFPKAVKGAFTVSLTMDEVGNLCNQLDLFTRLVLGQWDKIRWLVLMGKNADRLTNEYLDMVKVQIVPFLATHNYGICHPDLTQKVYDVYNIYKELMYKRGVGGVYGSTPMILAGDEKNIPEVTFPVTAEYTFPDNYEFGRIPEFEEWCKKTFPKPEYPFYEAYEDPYHFDETDNFYWVRYSDNSLTKATPGLRVVKRYHKIPEAYRDGQKVGNYPNFRRR